MRADGGAVKLDDYSQEELAAICEEARERFERISEIDRENRDNQKSDTKFVYTPGEQWPSDVKKQRQDWKEVCLEFNQLKQFVSRVVNNMRQNRPGIRVHAAGGDASAETAEIIQGMMRAIEYDSKAEAVYDNGGQWAVVGGRGWWRVVSEYVSNKGREQKLLIKPIADTLSVYADLDYQEPDASDRKYLFVAEDPSKKEFERQWPDAEPIDWTSDDKFWFPEKETVRVVDYYRRVCKTRKWVELSDGAKGYKDEIPAAIPEGVSVDFERDCECWSVEWFKIAGGQQVLAVYEWPGTIIPVIQVAGEDILVEGKRIYQGLTRHARDSQCMLNFGMTAQAIHLSLTPRAPWVAPAAAIAGYEDLYKNSNVINLSVLPYNHKDDTGEIPAPTRQLPAMPDQGWSQWCQGMLQMVKSTIGMYENSLSQKGEQTSGVAIRQKEAQGDIMTFNYPDNQARAIALTGRIIVEVMPKFYDTERIVHVIGLDDQRKTVTINQQTAAPDPATGALTAIRQNDITVGEYAISVEAGPSYQTKRQDSAEALTEFVRAFPPAAAVAGDLIVKSLDIADADVLSERLKLTLPPVVQQAEARKAKGQKPPDPAIMAEMQQKDQQLQQAAQTMEEMHKKIQELESGAQAKMQAAQLDAQAKGEQADRDAETRRVESQAQAQAAIEKAREDAGVSIHKANIEKDTRLQIAQIEQETAVEVASIQAGAKIKIEEMKPEPVKKETSNAS